MSYVSNVMSMALWELLLPVQKLPSIPLPPRQPILPSADKMHSTTLISTPGKSPILLLYCVPIVQNMKMSWDISFQHMLSPV